MNKQSILRIRSLEFSSTVSTTTTTLSRDTRNGQNTKLHQQRMKQPKFCHKQKKQMPFHYRGCCRRCAISMAKTKGWFLHGTCSTAVTDFSLWSVCEGDWSAIADTREETNSSFGSFTDKCCCSSCCCCCWANCISRRTISIEPNDGEDHGNDVGTGAPAGWESAPASPDGSCGLSNERWNRRWKFAANVDGCCWTRATGVVCVSTTDAVVPSLTPSPVRSTIWLVGTLLQRVQS